MAESATPPGRAPRAAAKRAYRCFSAQGCSPNRTPPRPQHELGRALPPRSGGQIAGQAALEDQIDKPMLEALRHQAVEKLALLRTEIEGTNAALRSATNDLYLELPPAIGPEPELDGEPDGNPLISTSWSWAETIGALIAHKSYLDGAGGGA